MMTNMLGKNLSIITRRLVPTFYMDLEASLDRSIRESFIFRYFKWAIFRKYTMIIEVWKIKIFVQNNFTVI